MIASVILPLMASSVVVAFILNALYKRTNHFNNQFVDVRKYWDMNKFPRDLQIVNLGSNHPKFGLDYSGTGLRGENCAVGPQTFEYDFAVLRKISPYLAANAVILIPICLQNFFLYRQKSRAVHAKYYTFLPKEDIVDYSRKERLSFLEYPLIFHPRLLRFLIRDVAKDTRLELTENPMKDDIRLNQDADSWIDGWNREFNITLPAPVLSNDNKSDIRNNIQLLRKTLVYCQEHDFRPIITILPVTEYLSSRYTEDFLNKHILRYIDDANVVGAPVLNYLKDSRFTSPDLYINSFFMNKKGRMLFTKEIIHSILTENA